MSEKVCPFCGIMLTGKGTFNLGELQTCEKCFFNRDESVRRGGICVTACRSIPTSALEAGMVEKMLTVFRYQLQLRQSNLTNEERTKISTDAHKIITEVLDLLKNEEKRCERGATK